jgi:hypothetical protein
MTSLRQIEANRQNALKSTGPKTADGKQRSRRNALRHGFTAETVIEPLESPEEYQAFEDAIVSEYLPQTPVEQELVHRLASLFWRLRRSTSIETGLLRMQSEILHAFRSSRQNAAMPSAGEGPAGPWLEAASKSARTSSGTQTVSRSFTSSAADSKRPINRATSRSASCAWPLSTTTLSTGSAGTRRRSGDSSPRRSSRFRRSSADSLIRSSSQIGFDS